MASSDKIEKQLEQYAWCMHSIKNRIIFLGEFLQGREPSFKLKYLLPEIEIGAIQLRKSLELIAMASITANEAEYRAVNDAFKKHWHASRIVKEIEKINPDFYPQPIKQPHENGQATIDLAPKLDYLTKERFKQLYEWCGGRLHALNPYRADRDEGIKYKNDLQHIEDSRQQIVRLLNQHRTVLSDDKTEIWCHMESSENGGKPQAYLVNKIPI